MTRLRALGLYLVALGFVIAFWITAGVSDFFLDRPFLYLTHDEWSENFVRSVARFPDRTETGLLLARAAFLLPAMVALALQLSKERDILLWLWDRIGAPAQAEPATASPHASARSQSVRTVAVGFAILATLFAALVSFSIIDGTLLLDDERSYLFQANLFAQGRLMLPTPPAALHNPMFLLSPGWMSKYPPGHAAVLALGALVGAPRVIPPLLGGLLVYFLYEFVCQAYGPRQALLAAALLASSGFVWCMAATAMSFTTFACAYTLSLWLLARGRALASAGEGARSFAGAGAALGFALTVRPYDAIALGVPLGIWLVVEAVAARASHKRWPGIVPFLLGGTPLVGLLLVYNWATTGSPFTFGYGLARDYSFGFFVHPIPGHAYVHTPLQAVAALTTGLARLDAWLLGFPLGLAFAWAGAFAAKIGPYDRLLLWLLASFFAAYAWVVSSGTWDVGPTYYFAIAPLVVVLVVRGIRAMRAWLAPLPRGSAFVSALPVVGVAIAVVTVVPIHLVRLAALTQEIDTPWRTVADAEVGDAIVVAPLQMNLAATGYALGYPYEIKSGKGTAHLVRPHSPTELEQARQFLGQKLPVFELVLDEKEFRQSGTRRYQVRPTT